MRSRDGAAVLIGFALLLGAWWVVLLLWGAGTLPVALLGGSAGACLLAGIALGAARRPPSVLADPDVSLGAPAVAAGIAAMVLGAEAGAWLVLAGAGAVVLGAVLLVREWRSGRRAVRQRGRR